ncbi:RNA polymerase Rpb2 domain 6 [Desulfonatronospira thiodismutans ASO3-1]|uniref:DNA-directed RNA polymerase n=1 Tax=Desulfonatronospira thiodismutans ASO3-1 TaxID=555779 RepID=D6SPT0_9BACT|nr:RNA polymerase Rpb2 domain 6 [Desulfonatronospira thiodismutans]EFI34756.1 RNA polymerase Rpb2 domain 6 [Desulfonatronospira thiodismutans ASO3-1]
MKQDPNRQEFESFIQMHDALQKTDLHLKGMHEMLYDAAGKCGPGCSLRYISYFFESDDTRPGQNRFWLILKLEREGTKIHVPATSFPCFTENGTLLFSGKSGAIQERRPIWQVVFRQEKDILPADWEEERKNLKENIQKYGLHPRWCRLSSLTHRLRYFLKKNLEKWKSRAVTNSYAASVLLAGSLDEAFYSTFYRRVDHFPLADTTNKLAETAQGRQVSAKSLRCHRKTMIGSKPEDNVRNLLPEHTGMICPVETPESESIGLVMHLARKARPELWSQDAAFNENDQRSEEGILKTPDPDNFLGYSACMVPYIQHTDPTRAMMGAKNMKQALSLTQGEAPLIRTGHEEEVFGRGEHDLDMDIGRNLLVAYLPWYGFNYEDGIVISRSAAEKFLSVKKHKFGPYFCPGNYRPANPDSKWRKLDRDGLAPQGQEVKSGDVLAAFYPVRWNHDSRSKKRQIVVNTLAEPLLVRVPDHVQGKLVRFEVVCLETSDLPLPRHITRMAVHMEIEESRPLEPGDKIMGRHGNKGVISRILPDREMPYFLDSMHGITDLRSSSHFHGEEQAHTHVEVILNPLGVIGRMNTGQLLECHTGLAMRCIPERMEFYQNSGMPFSSVDIESLRQDLLSTKIVDETGKARLFWRDEAGNHVQTGHASMIGVQYLMKLDHMARDKFHVCGKKPPRCMITNQPVKGRSRGGGLRLGEMENWCIIERQAWDVIDELLQKSEPDGQVSSNQALEDILYALGLELVCDDKSYVLRPHDQSYEHPQVSKPLSRAVNRKDAALDKTSYDQSIFGQESLKFLKKEARSGLSASGWGVIRLPFSVNHPLLDAYTSAELKISRIPVLPCRYRPLLKSDDERFITGTLDNIHDVLLELCSYYDGLETRKKEKLAQILKDIKEQDADIFSFVSKWLECRLDTKTSLLQVRQLGSGASKIKSRIKKICAAQTQKIQQKESSNAGLSVINEQLLSNQVFEARQKIICCLKIYYQYLVDLLQGKPGLLRGHILGRRFPLSGRAVIVPDPTLPLGRVRIPGAMYDEFFEHSDQENWILLNRPPSLLPSNIQAFSAQHGGSSKVIKLNPGLCAGFGADFDGDQMSAFALHAENALNQAESLMRPGAMPLAPKTGQPNLSMNLDIRLGIYLVQQAPEKLDELLTKYGLESTDKCSFFEQPDMEKNLKGLSKEKRESFMADVLWLCFKEATESGLSFSFFDLVQQHAKPARMDQDCEILEVDAYKAEYGDDPVSEANKKARKLVETSLHAKDNHSAIAILTKSKAASKLEQTTQLLHSRGGIRLPFDPAKNKAGVIHRSYTSGLHPADFFLSACATREAMMYKKLRTAHGGYFTRKLVEAGYQGAQVSGTEQGVFPEPFYEMQGFPAGLLSAHLLGEEGTQAAMKVFHTGQTENLDQISSVLKMIKAPPTSPEETVQMCRDIAAELNIKDGDNKKVFWSIVLQCLHKAGLGIEDLGPEQDNILAALSYGHVRKVLGRALTREHEHRTQMNLKEKFILYNRIRKLKEKQDA